MSLLDPSPNVPIPTNGSDALSARDVDRIQSSIRSDARKIKDALNRMMDDAEKLEAGGSLAPAAMLRKAVIVMDVGLDQIVFKATL